MKLDTVKVVTVVTGQLPDDATEEEARNAAKIAGVLAAMELPGLPPLLALDPSSTHWPPIDQSVYVLDGVAAPGSVDLGLPQDSQGIWVVASSAAPREIPRGDDAARQLAEAVEVLDRPYVVFLPAETWTVQELVTLCLAAVPPTPNDPYAYWSYDEGGTDPTCAVDLALPFPAEGPRIQGFR